LRWTISKKIGPINRRGEDLQQHLVFHWRAVAQDGIAMQPFRVLVVPDRRVASMS
jgi:hypothetical protein